MAMMAAVMMVMVMMAIKMIKVVKVKRFLVKTTWHLIAFWHMEHSETSQAAGET